MSPRVTTPRCVFGDGEKLEVETILMSIGRRPLSDGLVAEGTGVALDERGYVRVDEWMRTAAEDVFAIGDLVATPQLAHVGFAEAILVVKQILGERAVPVDYGKVPWAIYCHPEVAFVGMTEQAAVAAGHRDRHEDATRSAATAAPASWARPTGS